MELSEAVVAGLFSLRDKDPKHEICGILGVDNQIYPVTNISTSAECFVFSPPEWLHFKTLGIDIKAIYHSHPDNDPTPSAADVKCLQRHRCDGLIITADQIEVLLYEK